MIQPHVVRRSTVALAALAVATLAGCGDDDSSGASDAATSTVAASSTVVTSTIPPETPATDPPATSAPSGDAAEPPTRDDLLAQLSDQQIADVGGIECATELAEIFAAVQRYRDETGAEPASLDELYEAGYLVQELKLLEMVDDQLRPVDGSGCTDPGATAECTSGAATLTQARMAYVATHPGSEPTQADLVAEMLIPDVTELIDIVDGEVVATPDGPCDGVDLTIDWRQECISAKQTLEVASEAYYAQNGSYPASEADLVGEYLRFDSPIMDVADGEVSVVAGGPCDGLDLG